MISRAVYNTAYRFLALMPSRVRRRLTPAVETLLFKPEYYLVSYPKSGRTWLRMMIGSAAMEELSLSGSDPTDLESFSRRTRRFPTIRITHDTNAYKVSRENITFRSNLYAKSRIIFLVRDPRDVLISLFYDQKYRRVFEQDLPEFSVPDDAVTAEVGGLRNLLRFYNVWADSLPKTRGYMITHYEDLKADPATEIRRCLDFLGIHGVSDSSIAAGVERGRFDKMQEAERQGRFSHARLRPADPDNVSSFKVRKGVVGGYIEELSPAAIRQMDEVICTSLSDVFARYKYRTEANPGESRPRSPSATGA